MKTKTQPSATHTIIATAVEPMRIHSMDRAENYMKARINRTLDVIAEHGWNRQSAFPYPSARGKSVAQFRSEKADYDFALMITEIAQAATYTNNTTTVKGSRTKIAKLINEVRKSASSAFDAYVAKLTNKIGDGITSATIQDNNVWEDSDLVITRNDGTTEVWNTKCITNYSVYGLAYNQFPTRQIKAKKRR
jgi:hypothetical protein